MCSGVFKDICDVQKVAVEISSLKFAIGGLVIDSGALGIVGQRQLGMGIEGDDRLKGIECLWRRRWWVSLNVS
jgi:hypothetical protein